MALTDIGLGYKCKPGRFNQQDFQQLMRHTAKSAALVSRSAPDGAGAPG